MDFSTKLFAALVVAFVGGVILWANQRRWVNRSVFMCSVVVAAWQASSHLIGVSENTILWIRWTCSIGALAPLTLWLVKESILTTLNFSDRRWLLRNAG